MDKNIVVSILLLIFKHAFRVFEYELEPRPYLSGYLELEDLN